MSSRTIVTPPTYIPEEITRKVFGLAIRLRTSALELFNADNAQLDGPFTTATSGIHLDWCKALSPGHIMRQAIDCSLVDAFASWLTVGPSVDGRQSSKKLSRVVLPLSIKTMEQFLAAKSRYTVATQFLSAYDKGMTDIKDGLNNYVSLLQEKSAGEKTTSESRHDVHARVFRNTYPTFFETLIAASNPDDLKSATALGWEGVRQTCMQSSNARRTFWSEACKDLRDDFMKEKGWSIGVWPHLPEDLRRAAKGQASSLGPGLKGAVSETSSQGELSPEF